MLQSVPDPFDAYGPPQSEDQIFSILAPLSIMTQPVSSSSTSSPLTSMPEQGTSESLPSSLSSKKVTSWLPSNTSINNKGTAFPTEASAWAGVHSPPSTPPCSVSPPHNVSRKHSTSLHRKAESKLRSVLSVIEEPRSSRQQGSNANESDQTLHQSQDSNQSSFLQNVQNICGTTSPRPVTLDTPNDEPGADSSWSSTYGQFPHEYGYDSNSSTPRISMLFTPTAVPPDPSNDQDSDN